MAISLNGALLSALFLLSGAAIAQDASPTQEISPAQEPAPAPDASPAANALPAPEAAPTAGATPSLISAPPEGKGQIVFFRQKKFAGAAVRYKVREGDTELGKLSSGTYFVVPVEPGAHEYIVHSEAKDVFNIEVEPGETYYVLGTVTMGFMAGHPNLSPSDQATFASMASKLELAD